MPRLRRLSDAPIGRERLAIVVVDAGGHDALLGVEAGQDFLRRLFIVETERGGAVGSEHIGQDFQVVAHFGARRDLLVDDGRGRGKNQGGCQRDHNDQAQLVLDRQIAIGRFGSLDCGAECRHRDPVTISARLNNRELICRWACSLALGLISKRTRPSSILKLTIPPLTAKPADSPTVSTLLDRTSSSRGRAFCVAVAPTKRIWHDVAALLSATL